VVLLHGFPQHGGEWDEVVPFLHAAGLRTAAPDQRGYSPGARPLATEAYAIPELVTDVFGIADGLGAERFHLVGHDWGAIVGWAAAAADPVRVLSLTALSVPHPTAMSRAMDSDADQQVKSSYIQLFRQEGTAERTLLAADGAALWAFFAGSGLDRAGVERYIAPLREPGALTAALNWYRAMGRGAMSGVGVVRVPTTFLWSDGDIAIGRTAAHGCAEFVEAEYSFVPLPGVSHWIPDQTPEAVAAEILARVKQVPESSR
jgi:pimeloyl-ACP methyl ester carboxylesterase